ncbi:methyltransferase, TIGR00027 family [Sphingomonas sp. YR710]|jgi:methyltransferase (TIGR00027 family)|uniref:class I SAM-dependent methyltransferase n=1 Tax=Sphingomonas sp. YR710 TaxID=1882773 RepID=UPI00088DB542|nr:class I SAM-dependent methyltransferase [Sphingomonas sp. YR710]SDC06130.1 methyltransferase, TIGR00027 family [Sphingomonas sp. YR710]
MSEQIELTSVHNTAIQSAAIRAGHTLTGSEPKIFEDSLALAISGMAEQDAIAFCKNMGPSNASTCVVRSRVTEDRLAAARERGVEQYVILGAGLDTFALRMADRLGSLTVYEIDDPVFQQWKRERIESLGLKSPPQLRYAPCDFETMSIAEALAPAGFDADRPVFISWLGVTQYLTLDAIRETLKWAGKCAPGSEIVLTYTDGGDQSETLIAHAATRGVKLYSHPSAQEMTDLLREAGFTKIEQQTREQASERYFKDRADGLVAPEFQRMAMAIV